MRATPIFKSGQEPNLSNDRPILVLSVFSRLLEKLADEQLYDFLRARDLLSKIQFAFRKLHNTITSMLNITETWYKNVDERKLNMSIFLDLKKLLAQPNMISVIEVISIWYLWENTLLFQNIPRK